MSFDPPPLQNVSIKHLFATPLVVAELAPELAADLNPQISKLVLEKSSEDKGMIVSNHGGWQSDSRLPEWGGQPVLILLAAMRQMLRDVTIYEEDGQLKRGPIDWRVNGWANINRKGDRNLVHSHPGAYWSAVYYVAVDTGTTEKPLGGDIEFLDPRGPLPMVYNPLLHIGIQGYTTAGKSELHRPRAGQCIFFPSWLAHAVRPYIGDEVRISLAFNFST